MGQGRPTNAPSVWRRNPSERRLPQAHFQQVGNYRSQWRCLRRLCRVPRGAPVCDRYCNRLLKDAGRDGLMLKATGDRWFGGHTLGGSPPKEVKGMKPEEE